MSFLQYALAAVAAVGNALDLVVALREVADDIERMQAEGREPGQSDFDNLRARRDEARRRIQNA